MDDWGDPWADATETKPSSRELEGGDRTSANKTLIPGAFAPTSILPGFTDEAKWGESAGEETDVFTGWPCGSSDDGEAKDKDSAVELVVGEDVNSVEEGGSGEGSEIGSDANLPDQVLEDSNRPIELPHACADRDGLSAHPKEQHDSHDAWTEPKDGAAAECSEVAGAASEDTSPPRVRVGQTLPSPQAIHPSVEKAEDDDSTHPPSSPSDTSHSGPIAESPRTSLEDDQLAVKQAAQSADGTGDRQEEGLRAERQGGEGESDEFGDFESDGEDGVAEQLETRPSTDDASGHPKGPKTAEPEPRGASELSLAFTLDSSPLRKIFPGPSSEADLPPAGDSPISSPSSRKAWYRVTRKETLREFNAGADNDNYVRVTWIGSKVQSKVNSIVAKWSSEDRANGRPVLGGADAIFNWNHTASHSPSPSLTINTRKRLSISRAAESPRSIASPMSAASVIPGPTAIAQFSWSSPPGSASKDPEAQPAVTTTTSMDHSEPKANDAPPVTRGPSHRVLTGPRNPPSASLDLRKGSMPKPSHQGVLMSTSAPPASAQVNEVKATDKVQKNGAPIQPPQPSSPIVLVGSQAVQPPPTSAQSPPTLTLNESADDEEWGEMVQTPTTPSLPFCSTNGKATTDPSFSALSSVSGHPAPTISRSSTDPVAPLDSSLPSSSARGEQPVDPWAAADFSIFDPAPAASVSPLKHTRNPSVASAGAAAVPPHVQDATREASRPLSLPPVPHPTLPAASAPRKSRGEIEEDETVRRIVQGLPDLCYMLR